MGSWVGFAVIAGALVYSAAFIALRLRLGWLIKAGHARGERIPTFFASYYWLGFILSDRHQDIGDRLLSRLVFLVRGFVIGAPVLLLVVGFVSDEMAAKGPR
jgi:hypothetical protein